ncbi:hypothetical protein SAMN02910409_1415 [Prevotellaceae bacterium HUN156]|jgi:hypothetical protein|nr:hypothetical protein SAMN02910409_1415 [Prevotellaceae bacterium HUN156]
MRKILTLLLAIYVLISVVMPCHCDEKNHDHIASQKEQTVGQGQEHGEDYGFELCTPFCSCTSLHSVSYFSITHIDNQPMAQATNKRQFIYLMRKAHAFVRQENAPPEA